MLVVVLFVSEQITLLFGPDPEDFDSLEEICPKEGINPHLEKILQFYRQVFVGTKRWTIARSIPMSQNRTSIPMSQNRTSIPMSENRIQIIKSLFIKVLYFFVIIVILVSNGKKI
jgi:hypothetical protein